jgi:tetratricopeptide (TPR) repeat protein
MSRLYARYGLAHEFVRSATQKVDYWYARSRDGYRDALMFTQQAEREGSRGENLLEAELFEDAELAAVEALRLNAGLDPRNVGKLRLLLAQAIRGQLGAETDRDEELLVAAREAAALLAGDDDEGAGAARALIGDVHVRAGRYDVALEVYEAVIRGLGDGWGKRDTRRALRRATAGKFVCLRRWSGGRGAGLIDELYAAAGVEPGDRRLDPARHRPRLPVLRRRAAVLRAVQRGDPPRRRARESTSRTSALMHSAELLAPKTPKSSMTMLDEAVSVIGKAIEDELAVLAEREQRTAQRALERGEAPREPVQPTPDPVMLARQARAQTLRVELLIDPQPAPEAVLGELMPSAYRAATQGADTLAELVRSAEADDPRRRSLMDELETAVGWLVAVQRGSGRVRGATSRLTALAELAEEVGFAQVAERAREKISALGPTDTAEPAIVEPAAVVAEAAPVVAEA